jgi:hypothetical protein
MSFDGGRLLKKKDGQKRLPRWSFPSRGRLSLITRGLHAQHRVSQQGRAQQAFGAGHRAGEELERAGLIRFVGLCGLARGLLGRYSVPLLRRGTQAVCGVRC